MSAEPNPGSHPFNAVKSAAIADSVATDGLSRDRRQCRRRDADGQVKPSGSPGRRPVYCSPMGTAGPTGVPKIPFWEEVIVECWTEDLSGIKRITAMYRLGSGQWKGLYAASDLFSNGDPPEGGTTNIDKGLQHC